MPYVTPDQVRSALRPDTALDDTSAASLSDTQLADAVSAAAAQVDASLTARYQVPFPDGSVPDLIVSVTVDIAAYLATLTFRGSKDLTAEDPVVLRYTRANGILTGLANGSIDLPGTSSVQPAPAAAVVNPYTGRLIGLADFGLGQVPLPQAPYGYPGSYADYGG